MIINTNISSINIQRHIRENGNAYGKVTEKLSSGMRINSAADNAAGLSISEKMRGQIMGMETAKRNTQDGISLLQTADGALNEEHDILQRMRELTIQAGNGIFSDNDKKDIQAEIEQLKEELNNIAENTKFNNKNIFNEAVSSPLPGTPAPPNTTTPPVNPLPPLGPIADKVNNINAINNGIGNLIGDLKNGKYETQQHWQNPGDVEGEFFLKEIEDKNGNKYKLSEMVEFLGVKPPSNYNKYWHGKDQSYNRQEVINTLEEIQQKLQEKADSIINGSITSKNFNNVLNFKNNNNKNKNLQEIKLQIGANQKDTIAFNINKMDIKTLELNNISVFSDIDSSINSIDKAINKVSKERSLLGAVQNRLEHVNNNLNAGSENLQAAESRIRDTDIAKAILSSTIKNILEQTGKTLLAQVNQNHAQVLNLLH